MVWGAAGALLGLAARWARHRAADRGARCSALAIGASCYLHDTASRSPIVAADLRCATRFDVADAAAGRLPARGARAGSVGALARARRDGAPRAPASSRRVVARRRAARPAARRPARATTPVVLRALTPDAVGPLARAAGVLRRRSRCSSPRAASPARRRRAWQLAVAVAALSAALHVLHGFNHGTLASAARARSCSSRGGSDFDRAGRRPRRGTCSLDAARRRARRRSPSTALAALWVNRIDGRPAVHARAFAAARDRERAARAPRPRLAAPRRRLRRLVPALARSCSASRRRSGSLVGWLAPWRHRVRQEAHERELAPGARPRAGAPTRWRRSCSAPTSRTSSPPASRRSSPTASSAASRSSPATRSARRRRSSRCVARVRRARPRRDWRIAILGASERWLAALPRRTACMRSTTATRRRRRRRFSLEGRAIRKVRQSVHRLEQAGLPRRRACARARSTPTLRASSRRSRAPGAAGSPSAGS